MTCKQCKRSFHYCSSCDSDVFMDRDYCSEECYRQSDEWKQEAEMITKLIYSFSEEQLKLFTYYYENIDDCFYPHFQLIEECLENKIG